MVISRTVSVDEIDTEIDRVDVAEVVGGGMKADTELLEELEVIWADVAEAVVGGDEVVEGLLDELEIDGINVGEVVIGEDEVVRGLFDDEALVEEPTDAELFDIEPLDEEPVDEETLDEEPVDAATSGLDDTKVELVGGGTKGRPKVEVTKVVLNTVLKIGEDVEADDPCTIIGFKEGPMGPLLEGMEVNVLGSGRLEELVDRVVIERLVVDVKELS